MFAIGIIIGIWSLLYIFLPEEITGKKYEYITFLSTSIFIFSFLFYIVTQLIITGVHLSETNDFFPFISFFWLFLTIYHFFFPFKRVERNKTVSFVLMGITVISLIGIFITWGLVCLSNM